MVRNEIWTGLLAYNLIRQTILEAAIAADPSPRELSFTAAMRAIAAGWTAVLISFSYLFVLASALINGSHLVLGVRRKRSRSSGTNPHFVQGELQLAEQAMIVIANGAFSQGD